MEFTSLHQDGHERLALSGSLTFADNQRFRKIMALAHEKAAKAIELDFTLVDFIDSAGLGMLLLLRDECIKNGMALTLHGATGQVQKIFVISRFDQIFSMDSPH